MDVALPTLEVCPSATRMDDVSVWPTETLMDSAQASIAVVKNTLSEAESVMSELKKQVGYKVSLSAPRQLP